MNFFTHKKLFLFLCLFGLPIMFYSQIHVDDEQLPFEEKFKQSFHSKPKLDIKFDNRFSFIRDNDVKTFGIKIGVSFKKRVKFGLGMNLMLLPIERTVQQGDSTLPVNLEYFYLSPYLEYVYFSSKRWEFSLSLQMGIGEASYQYTNTDGKKVKFTRSAILSYEPATLIDYKIIRWFGIGTGIGYRLIYFKSSRINENFSSPEYVLKLKIYLGEIFRTITGKELDIDE